ncbi:MAG: di-heme oxidoredictase family protein [Verrucomicrobiota bacterium]
MKKLSTQIVIGLGLSASLFAVEPVSGKLPPPPADGKMPPPPPGAKPPTAPAAGQAQAQNAGVPPKDGTKPPAPPAPPAGAPAGAPPAGAPPAPPAPPAGAPPKDGMRPPGPGVGQQGKPGELRDRNGRPAPAALPGISAEQLVTFLDGLDDFVKEETPETGLGPIFNDVSCVACHSAGGAGGAGRKTVVRFGRITDGVFDPLTELGGSLLQKRSISRDFLEHIPKEANVMSLRITTPLFGAGLIEAIPDATILANVDLPKTDGVKGRAAMIKDPVSGEMRVGRFGWKAQHASLLGFSADAYLNEMGITNRFFPTENAPNGDKALLAKADKFSDPEDVEDPVTKRADIDRVASFMQLLAPLPPGPSNDKVKAGAVVFEQVGCVQCHIPKMTTGPDGIAGTKSQTVALYSDLLLHDMGALGDGIAQPPATMKEMRTSPLWGLRARDRYLHDGRASTVDLAIRAHDGESKTIRERYQALPADKRQALLEFLKSI